MCEMTPDCDGRTGQLGRCKECGADRLDHEPARFSGGAGSRRHRLSDDDYRREMSKIEEMAGH
jgi:hypothetical protein